MTANRKSEVELEFGDGPHLFALKIAQIEELQDKCGAGIEEIYQRLWTGKSRLEDVFETLRLGLIGGGMPAIPARKLVEQYVLPLSSPGDPASPLTTARVVVSAIMVGLSELAEDETPGKDGAAMDESTQRPFTDKDSSADSPLGKSES